MGIALLHVDRRTDIQRDRGADGQAELGES
jgi:hypothetical protein